MQNDINCKCMRVPPAGRDEPNDVYHD